MLITTNKTPSAVPCVDCRAPSTHLAHPPRAYSNLPVLGACEEHKWRLGAWMREAVDESRCDSMAARREWDGD